MPTTPRRGKSTSVVRTPAAKKPSAGTFDEVPFDLAETAGSGSATRASSKRKTPSKKATPMTRSNDADQKQENNKSKKLSEYKSPEPSFLSRYIFFPFYDWIVCFFPRGWVPNYITGFGIACTLLSSFMLFSCLPASTRFLNRSDEGGWRLFYAAGNLSTMSNQVQFQAPVSYLPEVVVSFFATCSVGCMTTAFFIIAGVLNALYCTADNTDGRQARRTKQTSFTGEYLDHGLDCVTALLSTFLMALCLGSTTNGASAATAAIALVTCLSHVLHLSDKVFIWGNSFVTVDEAMVGFAVAPIAKALWIPAGGLGQFQLSADTVAAVATYLADLPVLGATLSGFVGQLTLYSIVDFVMVFFLLVQVGMIKDLLSFNKRNAMNGAWITLWCVTGIFIFLAASSDHQDAVLSYHNSGGVMSFMPRGLLTYPALWATTYCFLASIITHIPILAQCARLSVQNFWPLSLVIGTVVTFIVSPLYGCAFSIVAHSVQVVYNIRYIEDLGAKRAILAKKE